MEEECSDLVAGPLLPSEVCSSICIVRCLTITCRGRKNTGQREKDPPHSASQSRRRPGPDLGQATPSL